MRRLTLMLTCKRWLITWIKFKNTHMNGTNECKFQCELYCAYIHTYIHTYITLCGWVKGKSRDTKLCGASLKARTHPVDVFWEKYTLDLNQLTNKSCVLYNFQLLHIINYVHPLAMGNIKILLLYIYDYSKVKWHDYHNYCFICISIKKTVYKCINLSNMLNASSDWSITWIKLTYMAHTITNVNLNVSCTIFHDYYFSRLLFRVKTSAFKWYHILYFWVAIEPIL